MSESNPVRKPNDMPEGPNPNRNPSKRPRLSKQTSDNGAYMRNDIEALDDAEERNDAQQQHLVRRACNECRQQKLRCDVVHEPFRSCSRCQRMKLECRIDTHFRRVGKRSKYSAMESEIIELRRLLAESKEQRVTMQTVLSSTRVSSRHHQSPNNYTFQGIRDVDLDTINNIASPMSSHQYLSSSKFLLEAVQLSEDRIEHLFNLFFRHYHPFLPLLDRDKPPQYYFNVCPLLAWTITIVASRRYIHQPDLLESLSAPLRRLLWSTIAQVPHNYHTVKALCILCMWPLATNSVWTDPSYMLCGVMIQTATQIGLHMPANAQDFTKDQVDLSDEDIDDRLRTWAACSIVAQSIATSFGQRPMAFYNWTLEQPSHQSRQNSLPIELRTQLEISKFCHRVTETLYCNKRNPFGLVDHIDMTVIHSVLVDNFHDLESRLRPCISIYCLLHLQAAKLHLAYIVFFDIDTSRDYKIHLMDLHSSVVAFLQTLIDLEKSSPRGLLSYVTDYILQMIVSAGFALYRVLNSFFTRHIETDRAVSYFSWVVAALKQISVRENDRAARLAVVLAELWRASGASMSREDKDSHSTLQLQVRCRMSMSHVFDSVWRWRQDFERKGRTTLHPNERNGSVPVAATINPVGSPSLVTLDTHTSILAETGTVDANEASSPYQESMYNEISTLDGMLQGFIDFPYDFSGLRE